jgi:phosphate transport system protein
MTVLQNGNLDLIQIISQREKEVNQLEIEGDDLCNHVIARHQPTASDLRLVIISIKMLRDLERIGDEAEKVARMAKSLHHDKTGLVPKVDMSLIAKYILQMMKEALVAYQTIDISQSAQIIRDDMKVDEAFSGILRQLITFMMEDPRTISHALEIVFVAKAIERIGDHIKNMAEHVIYLARGKDVRHLNADEIEQELAHQE